MVLGQGARIDQQAPLAPFLHPERRVVLAGQPLEEKGAVPDHEGWSDETREELLEARAEPIPAGPAGDPAPAEVILGRSPGPGLWIVGVLQPAVRVGHAMAQDGLDGVDPTGRGVGHGHPADRSAAGASHRRGVNGPGAAVDEQRTPAAIDHTVGMRVLVVDDEPAVRQALDRALRFEGYETEMAEDGTAALVALAERPADAVVLDVAMPRLDGLEVCRRIRGAGDSTPILLLTARAQVADRVAGLDAGADDYLVKPFALEELLARLRALLRRSAPLLDDEVLRFSDLSLDPATREVKRGDRRIELTRTEFLLLELLLRNARQVLPREVIFDRVWGYDFGANSNSLEVYIGYLRRKTEADGEPRLLHTVRGVGYVLREPQGG